MVIPKVGDIFYIPIDNPEFASPFQGKFMKIIENNVFDSFNPELESYMCNFLGYSDTYYVTSYQLVNLNPLTPSPLVRLAMSYV